MFRPARRSPSGGPLERFDGPCLVNVDHEVELLRQPCVEVMTLPLGLRQVDHANRALEVGSFELGREHRVAAKRQHEPRDAGLVKQPFVAAREGWADVLALRGGVPLGCGGHRSCVGREADVHGGRTEMIAHDLSDIQFAGVAHVGGTRVAQMRVVRPQHQARPGLLLLEERQQLADGPGHVLITEVPRLDAASEHRPVVLFGVSHEARVLRREEEVVGGDAAVAAGILHAAPLQREQLGDDLALARGTQSERRRVAVRLHLVTELIEARVADARAARGFGIDFSEIGEHRFNGCAKAVQVEAVEADPSIGRLRVVVRAEPADEIEDVGVAPHPGGEAPEAGQRFDGIRVCAGATNVAVHAIGVGPVGFDGDGGEPFLGDQPLRDQRAFPVELVCAVAGFADHHDTCVADARQKRVVVVGIAAQTHRTLT